jgi:hypothetical protein
VPRRRPRVTREFPVLWNVSTTEHAMNDKKKDDKGKGKGKGKDKDAERAKAKDEKKTDDE